MRRITGHGQAPAVVVAARAADVAASIIAAYVMARAITLFMCEIEALMIRAAQEKAARLAADRRDR